MQNPNSHFAALRTQARSQRDKAITQIRAEYQTSLLQIAELEQRLLGRIDTGRMKVSAAIERVIPQTEQFTTLDVLASLEGMDSTRVWPKPSIHRHITKLRELGLVRRLKRARVNAPAIYIRCDASFKGDDAEKSLRQYVLEAVTKPMRIAEIIAALLAAGYKTSMVPGHFRTHVLRVLRESGFKERGGKWDCNPGR